MNLSKDADKMICYIYQYFLKRRQYGTSKSEARRFDENFLSSIDELSQWSYGDISDTLEELKQAGLVKIFICGNFDLTNSGIIYLENRFKNNLIEVTDFLAKFMP